MNNTIKFLILIQISFGMIAFVCTAAKRRNSFSNMLAPKQVLLKSVRQCDGKDDLLFYLAPFDIVQEEKNKYYTYGEVEVKQDFPNGFRANVDVKQCPADFNLLKCTTFVNNLGTNQLCEILKIQSDAYSPFLDEMKPRPLCPLKKGVFKVDRIPITDNVLRYTPIISESNWHINITGFVHNKMVACVSIRMSIKQRRE